MLRQTNSRSGSFEELTHIMEDPKVLSTLDMNLVTREAIGEHSIRLQHSLVQVTPTRLTLL